MIFREKHTNRRLKWIYNHSHADLRTCATQKMYVLKVTTFQLGILNSFNEADQLTLSEIRRETALENKGLFKGFIFRNVKTNFYFRIIETNQTVC